MSSSNRYDGNPDNDLTRAEVEHLDQLETIVQRGLETYVEVGNALAGIRDARLYRSDHRTIEAYLGHRWEIAAPQARRLAPLHSEGSDALTRVWEQALREFGGKEVTAADIRLTVHKRRSSAGPTPERRPLGGPTAELRDGKLVPQLRWLLTQATGTIADVAHRLETRATEVDDDARAQLQDDIVVLDEELATLKALLFAPVDWDAEYERLLAGEIPPFENSADDGEDR